VVSLKDIVRNNTIALRGFLMGIPALALSIVSTIAGLAA
jgi:hypothetical protein